MKRKFAPDTVLFSPTTRCNLACAHCDVKQGSRTLSPAAARKFLKACNAAGIRRVGFTGGEPFLALDFLCALTREAVRLDMRFSRITTNGAWFSTHREMEQALRRLIAAGYDGDICVSIDAFHRQDLRKVAAFIKQATGLAQRPDAVSVAAIKGVRESGTLARLKDLVCLLQGRFLRESEALAWIKNNDLFIRISFGDYSSVGKAGMLKHPWKDERWFKDDYCRGPGNVLFVLPDGTVKPCCGYADTGLLTLGSIYRDAPATLITNARKNPFVAAIFSRGLAPIRKDLEKAGVTFPGKTTDHCFFCDHLARKIQPSILDHTLENLSKRKT